MGNAFTPGLLVTSRARVQKLRHLPIGGEATVSVNETVSATDIVARAQRPGNIVIVRASEQLELDTRRLPSALRVKEGDTVEENEILGEVSHFFGLIKNTCRTPVTGVIEEISDVTGHISVRQPPHEIRVTAYISGTVNEVTDAYVGIETEAAIVQGIFGLGGECYAPVHILQPWGDITADMIDEACEGKIIVGSGALTAEAVNKAVQCHVKGIVAGSIGHEVLDAILGEPIGVAITGQEAISFTLVVTEGFGAIPMAEATKTLLQSMNGAYVALNGTTQIRAGVVRPEIIRPLEDTAREEEAAELAVARALEVGTRIRIIRAPYFGALATVTALPEQPIVIETGATVRVLHARCDDGKDVYVPRANVEIIA